MWALRDKTTGFCHCPTCGHPVRSYDLRCPGCKGDIEIRRQRLSPIEVNNEKYSPLMIMKSAAGYYLGRLYFNEMSGWMPGTRQTDYVPNFQMAVTALNDYPENRRSCAENAEIYKIEDEGGFD
jgi:hypothetical protein